VAEPTVAASEDPVEQLFRQKLAPFQEKLQRVDAMERELQRERVNKFIAKQEKMDPDDVPTSNVWKELLDVAQQYGVRGESPEHEAKLAYELLKKRRMEKASAEAAKERERDSAIVSNQPEPSRAAAPSGSAVRKVSAKEIGRMSVEEYQALLRESAKAGIALHITKE
jgi:hypothetical protein